MMLILMILKAKPESVLIEEDKVKKNPKISDADIDFEIVGKLKE